jgi:hypothetical protein
LPGSGNVEAAGDGFDYFVEEARTSFCEQNEAKKL